jgi:pimeloyl-ACP methyl ester carboxylesterase
MAGSEDPLVPPVNSRIIAMLIPNNRLFILPGGGHLFLLHSIDKVVPMIRTFLETETPLTALPPSLTSKAPSV